VDALVAGWRDRIRAAAAARAPLRVVGGGSKDFYGQELCGERFEAAAHRGVVDYDPTELVITARGGTPLAEIEAALAGARQMLAFEPPHFGAGATLGGCVAAGLSGPRRPYAGAVRDVVLGVRLLDGRGDDLSFGGRVMKNVAGFDVSRLIAGSLGTLGVILEVSLRCLPRPASELTLTLELPAAAALARCHDWGRLPLPVSATCWEGNRLQVRLSGAESAVAGAARRIGGEPLADAATFWDDVREQRHPFFAGREAPLCRASVRATAPQPAIAGAALLEWSGGLRWFQVEQASDIDGLRAWARTHGGHVTLFRAADKSAGVFQPLPPPLLALHQRIKATLDPAGIFNPRRMYAEL
jgi:glycolate oxidase FAD binding subunit